MNYSARGTPVEVRLKNSLTIDSNGCWLWLKYKDKKGYGRIQVNGKPWLTHRVSYELHVGHIPEGLQIDHLCRVRHCCNPSHLEPVTHTENVSRGEKANRTHCPQGHEYTEENASRNKNGRTCRECGRARHRAKYRKQRKETQL